MARGRGGEWYRGTADAVLQNLGAVEQHPADTILVLAGDHIYKMDYQPFVQAHRRKRADVTIGVRQVPLAEATRMGILALDDSDRIVDWQEEVSDPGEFLQNLKGDLDQDEIVVFTPAGEVVQLPHAATPVDFAYAIHTEIGHSCIGARVDGGLVGLDHALRSGETVGQRK